MSEFPTPDMSKIVQTPISEEKPPVQDQTQEASVNNKENIVPQEVLEHVQRMRVVADNTGAKCVDGGYHENEAVGEMAIPGGHLGVSMALLKLGYSPREAFDLVADYVGSNGGRYGWHTDKHEGHDGVITGCGHCNAAIKQAEKYGLDGSKVQELLDIVRQEQIEGKRNMELVVLEREHDEHGILVVTGREHTVKPWDEERNIQYFIYDQARHQEFLQGLTDHLSSGGREISYGDLWEASNSETTATLGLLGSSKGKPMYTVNVDGEAPQIAFFGNAPTEV